MGLSDELEKEKRACAGCGVCLNICKSHAIVIKKDKNGFPQPMLDATRCKECLLCESVCPQLHAIEDNESEPKCYSVQARNAKKELSALNAVFQVISTSILTSGGYVCSPSFEENFHGVSYRFAKKRKDLRDLPILPGLPCEAKTVYTEVKQYLDQDYSLLFCGIPCHVAALRNFLDREYENLITLDLLCEGTVSDEVYTAYLDEITMRRKVKNMSFVPVAGGVKMKFEDGTEYLAHPGKDPYFRGIQNGLGFEKACHTCRFTGSMRQGDLSLGVFFDHADEALCCLTLNNKRGEAVFQRKEIARDIVVKKEVPVGFLEDWDCLQKHSPITSQQKRFFSLLQNRKKFSYAVTSIIEQKFDIALTGVWTAKDYGYQLSYYALYCVLKELGYTVLMLEHRRDIKEYEFPVAELFCENPYPVYDVAPIHKNIQEQRKLNGRVSNFLVGSGRVWDYEIVGEDSYKTYCLDFAKNYRKRISFGSYFGRENFRGSNEEERILIKELKNFDAVSTGENSDGEYLKKKCNIETTCVLDPLLLCSKECFKRLIEKSKVYTGGSYLFSYLIQPDENSYGIDKLAKSMGYRWISMVAAGLKPEHWPYAYENNPYIEDLVKYIADSKLVVTDSFHGVCLSVLYRKPFLFITGWKEEGRDLRITCSFLERLKLADRTVVAAEDLLEDNIYKSNVDYTSVYNILKREKERSMRWLKKRLTE